MKGWVPIAESASGLWAALIKSFLENAGIPARVENEQTHHLFGCGLSTYLVTNPALGPLRLYVPEKYASQAKAYIEYLFSL